ncbi:hypothetical protein [Actinokineospora xionganensis]|uniref:PE family protein n=1 Tax=Actinokineospora xionganensis TaxID=2684470 RepID=A0ABR7L969_9PSEU|nr:hypothetical protein [Actinokineospora xionganensis]MBC6449103.1 hypothetical protein [Actinokineospora xionganensis]
MDAFDSIAGSLDRASALGSGAGGSVGTGLRGALPPPPGSGGKFNFAPNEIRTIVKDWLALADDYKASIVRSDRTSELDGPGDEVASERHAMTASASFNAYFDSVQLKYTYCLEQAAKFQESLDRYLGTDEASKIKLRLKEDVMPRINDRPAGRASDEGI